MCKTLKEKVLGDGKGGDDEMEQMLMGDAYHVTLFKRGKQEAAGETERLATFLNPTNAAIRRLQLEKSLSTLKVSTLDEPDYNLIVCTNFKTMSTIPVKPMIGTAGPSLLLYKSCI
jgi:hypothetical protein